MSAAPYTCKTCGVAVVVLPDGTFIRACAHHDAIVLMNFEVTLIMSGADLADPPAADRAV